jgi:hypothetical protein
MSNKEIPLLAVNINNLCQQQFETLKKHIIDTLIEAIGAVIEEDFVKAKQMTFYSPAGDDMGWDNDCIDFGFNGTAMDFPQAIYALKDLKECMTKEIER